MLLNILSTSAVIVAMLLIRSIVEIFPSLMACLSRAKECFNLESSVKLSRDRDLVACAMILPFCLAMYRFQLTGAGFMYGFSEDVRLIGLIALFMLYILFRYAVFYLFRPQRISKKTYQTAGNAAHTYFIILTFIILATGGIMSFIEADQTVIRSAIIWLSAGIYGLFLLRKLQIFMTSCSVFTAFLYLCALEIIPTGTLVVSAIIF